MGVVRFVGKVALRELSLAKRAGCYTDIQGFTTARKLALALSAIVAESDGWRKRRVAQSSRLVRPLWWWEGMQDHRLREVERRAASCEWCPTRVSRDASATGLVENGLVESGLTVAGKPGPVPDGPRLTDVHSRSTPAGRSCHDCVSRVSVRGC